MTEALLPHYTTLDHWPAGAGLGELHGLIFSRLDVHEQELIQRLEAQRDPLVQLAWLGERLVGYKIGYQRKQGHFYSWIGGVDPAYRRQGIAARLMQDQHAWCAQQGYASIRTHTKNQWREMLILNIRHGFDIIGTLTDEFGEAKLILEKRF